MITIHVLTAGKDLEWLLEGDAGFVWMQVVLDAHTMLINVYNVFLYKEEDCIWAPVFHVTPLTAKFVFQTHKPACRASEDMV